MYLYIWDGNILRPMMKRMNVERMDLNKFVEQNIEELKIVRVGEDERSKEILISRGYRHTYKI